MSARILIIDDSTTVTKLLNYQFSADGYEVVTANDGPAGLKAAEESPPDVVILDVMMPEMDGFEVCSRLRSMANTQSTPIVMLTSMAASATEKESYELGADYYVVKPYDTAELKALVRSILQHGEAGE